MIKLTTIGWGNGQSNLLDAFYDNFWSDVEITSIVSMSDDGRTTWELMWAFKDELWLHLPPPGDLRRCLFSLSGSQYRDYFKLVFEYIFLNEESIQNFTVFELFTQVNKELLFFWRAGDIKEELKKFVEWETWDLYSMLKNEYGNILDFKLPLTRGLKWHKFWNILMASLYYNFEENYDTMIDFMHNLLDVRWKVIPVTTKKARIRAILWNWEIIESQDRISNVAEYSAGIADLELADCSTGASHDSKVHDSIINADYILVWPWDLFTSIISNFIIWWVKESLQQSDAKIIYIWNSTNKWWETMGLTQLDFINKIERFLWKRIDYFILNDKKPILSEEEKVAFKNDISVKWWDFLFLSPWEKSELIRRKIEVIEADLLDNHSFYKHNKQKISKIILDIINK
jgi:uncharacterized cofD-like protein